jgi:AraC-type transcriptional regulator
VDPDGARGPVISRLKSAGVPVVPLLRRVGLTPEVIADPEERLIVRSQITLLDEAAIALQDDCLGFTLARDFDPREIGLLYYVMASSQTLGDALKARGIEDTAVVRIWLGAFPVHRLNACVNALTS